MLSHLNKEKEEDEEGEEEREKRTSLSQKTCIYKQICRNTLDPITFQEKKLVCWSAIRESNNNRIKYSNSTYDKHPLQHRKSIQTNFLNLFSSFSFIFP
jgi:hypothetical protein